MDGLKQLPYSLEAEQAVLGAILIDPVCISEVVGLIKTKYFYVPQHKEIFEAILEMFNESHEIDVVTILEKLKERGVYDEAGGKEYLFRLSEAVPTSKNVSRYAEIVSDKAVLRELINASDEIEEMCFEGAGESKDILDSAEQKIYNITRDRDSKGFTTLSQAVISSLDRLHKLSGEDRDFYMGVPTYFHDLDKLIVGLNNSDLMIIASRPGMGKTSLALNLAQNIATKGKRNVAIFSLEMSNEQLAERMLSSEALVDSQKIRRGDLNDSDWEKLAGAAGILGSTNILLDDRANITVSEMKAKLRRVKNLGLVIIDYLQLMTSGRRSDNRVAEVSEISRSLKIMAKDLNVPVICLSQLSRGPEARKDNRPLLSDLRESGAIEQDADLVMFLYREDYYNKECENRNICECIVQKNRHGSTGTIELQWLGEYTRFTSLEKVHYEPKG